MRPRDEKQRQATSLVCRCCGRELPVSQFQRLRSGTYRHECNHCRYELFVKPSRQRRILRELEEREGNFCNC